MAYDRQVGEVALGRVLPPVHHVFEGGYFAICDFGPRKVDYHEVMLDAIGSISLHPGRPAHGPQPSTPRELGEGGRAVEDPASAWSWAGRGPQG